MVENRSVGVVQLLEAASLLVPEESATENDITVGDVWEYLVRDEWEVAVALLEELGDSHELPMDFWEALADAAAKLHLERSAAWCRWRCYEARNGVIRANLTLLPAEITQRRTPIPGAGTLRPLWDLGDRSPAGKPTLHIASLWIEGMPHMEPGGQSLVRLAPLTPSRWQHLQPGQHITMHEDQSIAGTAVIQETHPNTSTE
jgi:hypothetical protein